MPTVHIPVDFPEKTPPSELNKLSKSIHEYGRKLANGKPSPVPRNSASALGASRPQTLELHKALDAAGVPKHDDPYQRIIRFRATKAMPEEIKSAAQKAIADFSNGQFARKTK
jgi:hypothetical protein